MERKRIKVKVYTTDCDRKSGRHRTKLKLDKIRLQVQ